MTESWTEDVHLVEAAIRLFSEDRAVTNDCQVALFETDRDDHLHVNVTHRYPTRTAHGWVVWIAKSTTRTDRPAQRST